MKMQKGLNSSSVLRAFLCAIAAIFLCQLLPARPAGHAVGWGASQLSPGIVVTNIAARGAENLGLRSDGSIIAWGWNPDVPRSAQDTVAISMGGPASGGYPFSLALTTNGTVVGWGDNTYGQITPPSGLSNVVAIAAGGYHSLALKSDGTVVAWGYNNLHQKDVPLNLSNVVAIAAGEYFSLALKADGTLVPWGGSLPIPSDATNLVGIAGSYTYAVAIRSNGGVLVWGGSFGATQQSPALSNAVSVAIGADAFGYHVLALGSNGAVYAWGYNEHGQSTVPTGLSNVVAIAAGTFHSVALKNDGTVVGWGDNSGSQTNFPAPVDDIASISAGAAYNLALKRNGTVFDWAGSPKLPAGLSNITAVAAGIGNGLALRNNGTLIAWGDNQNQQTNVPPGLNGVAAIAMSTYHCFAVKSNGTLVIWGYSPGLGSPPAGLSNVVAVSASPWPPIIVGGGLGPGDFALALKGDGTVVGWGYAYQNANGPTNVPAGLSNVVSISAGGGHGLALLNDSTVIGWGFNHHGEATGIPNLISPYASTGQVMIAGQVLSNVVAIAAGYVHSLALKNDGTVVAWGWNTNGEATVPAGVSNVVAISAGFYQSLAIMADLKIDSIHIAPQGPALDFHTFAGQQYSVEYSSDLTPGSWLPLPGGNVSGTGSDAEVTDSDGATAAGRFYRLRLVP
jgi:alpha-tubulin suppressor-like RCC1 family protein